LALPSAQLQFRQIPPIWHHPIAAVLDSNRFIKHLRSLRGCFCVVCGNIDPVFQQFEFFHLKQIKRLKSVRCLSYTEDSKKANVLSSH
jgi:hypothetical protein